MAKKTAVATKRALNAEQQAVVDHVHGPLRVGAVAGSGKTTALIERAASLIENGGVAPSRVLLISFSTNARSEMEKRLAARLPGVDVKCVCRTFHSLGFEIFKEEAEEREWFVDTTKRLWRMAIREAGKRAGINLESKGAGVTVKSIDEAAALAKTTMAVTPRALRKLGKVDDAEMVLATKFFSSREEADLFLSLFHLAEDIREGTGVLHNGTMHRFVTFDDMVTSAALLLRRADVRKRWSERWSYIMQDEMQDEAPVQGEIAEALASGHRNYMVVGDPAQAIFGFREARPERLLAFEQSWPGAKTVVMDRNYRSGREIIEAANKVIAHMPPSQVIAKTMVCERNMHAYVGAHAYRDSAAEADVIAKNIVTHFEQGIAWKDQAVLVRMNFMTRSIEMALASHGIPYRLVSGDSFFKLAEVKIVLGYLRVAMDRADQDDVEASLSNPGRRIGKVFFDAMAQTQKSAAEGTSWLDVVRSTAAGYGQSMREQVSEWAEKIEGLRRLAKTERPESALSWLVEKTELDKWLAGDAEQDSMPQKNIDEVAKFAKGYETVAEMLDAIEKIVEHRQKFKASRNVVSVSTVHRAKGMEWPVVYLPYATSALFPAPRADMNEERRLFYVAVTRAMDELWLSYPAQDTRFEQDPSPFFGEAGFSQLSPAAAGRQVNLIKIGTQMELL